MRKENIGDISFHKEMTPVWKVWPVFIKGTAFKGRFLKGTAFKKGVFLRDVFDPDYTEFHVWEINHRAAFSKNRIKFYRALLKVLRFQAAEDAVVHAAKNAMARRF